MGEIARTRSFRVAFALAVLAAHLYACVDIAHRYGKAWNLAPGQAPAFVDEVHDTVPQRWDRLAVSRWDSQHYIDLALRGHSQCAPRADARTIPLEWCHLNFWPGYPAIGWLASLGGRLPIDLALLGVSLVASFAFLLLWTGRTMVDALGVGGAYASLLAFNLHCSGFALVTIQTEPLLLVCTLGSMIALMRRRYVLAGLLAGGATVARVSGLATALACGVGILASMWFDRPTTRRDWVVRVLAAALAGWATFALLVYFQVRLHDAFAYFHAHEVSYHHAPLLQSLLHPKVEWFRLGVRDGRHAALWVAAMLLWFTLGHREALRRFDVPTQAFAYVYFAAITFLCVAGSLDRAFEGNSRYTLAFLPAFFAMGALMRKRPTALALWLAMSFWTYREAELCFYSGGIGHEKLGKCDDI